MSIEVFRKDLVDAFLRAEGKETKSALATRLMDAGTQKEEADRIAEEEFRRAHAEATAIVDELIAEAYRNGFPGAPVTKTQYQGMTEGNATRYVFLSETTSYCVAKVDPKKKKVAEEAQALIKIARGDEIPSKYAGYFPRVYAARTESPPFAYIMEYFPEDQEPLSTFQDASKYVQLGKCIFSSTLTVADMSGLANSVIDPLFSIYRDTLNFRLKPNVSELYLQRIKGRLVEAAALDPKFEEILSHESLINGTPHSQYEKYLDAIREKLDELAPPFVSFVHGDPNYGNILIRKEKQTFIPRFIDIKEWLRGDYVFDIGKIVHSIESTARIEKFDPKGKLTTPQVKSGIAKIDYELRPNKKAGLFIKEVVSRAEAFAKANNDSTFKKRLALSIASNLLGLPFLRLEKKNFDFAVMLYCEGMKKLREFAEML